VASPVDLLWRVSAGSSPDDPSTGPSRQPTVNPRGDVLVTPGVPVNTEPARFGHVWRVQQTTPSAPGTTLPTTLAGITLWNGEQDNGALYLIRRIFALVTTTVAAASPSGCVTDQPG
jgi:hypothetical protein